MEAKPRGSSRQARTTNYSVSISLNFVLYINRVHRARTRAYARVLRGARARPRLRSDAMEDTIHFDRRRRRRCRRGDANSGRRTCVTLTLVLLPAHLCTSVVSCVRARAHLTQHPADKLPREERSRAIPELDIRRISRTRVCVHARASFPVRS